MASKGYPGDYKKGFIIENATSDNIYHMGTKFDENGNYRIEESSLINEVR